MNVIEINDLIKTLITQLKEEEDTLLIMMLNQYLEKANSDHLNRHSVTDAGLRRYKIANHEFLRKLSVDNEKIKKIDHILYFTNDCQQCKYGEYGEYDNSKSRCIRCSKNCEKLYNLKATLYHLNDEKIMKFLNNPEVEMILKCKSMINKLKTKLHETSKC